MDCRIHHNALDYVSFGKPNPFVFKNAEIILRQLQLSDSDNPINNGKIGSHSFKTLYMIGDNPLVDIKGARQVCLSNPFGFQIPFSASARLSSSSDELIATSMMGYLSIVRQDILGFLF